MNKWCRITVTGKEGTIYSYLENDWGQERGVWVNEELDKSDCPAFGVLESLLQSDDCPPCFYDEGIVSIKIEEDDRALYNEPNMAISEIKDYLDNCIMWWRSARRNSESNISDKNGQIYDVDLCIHYIDAFQSVRSSIFGELLPKEEER